MLIAHESRAVRSILRRRALADAPEFFIDEAETEERALAALAECAFDLVLCDETLVGQPGHTWKEQLLEIGCSRTVGFVYLVSEATTETRRKELAALGACAFIDASSSGTDIAFAIASVFDPRHRREHRRVSLPGSRATIRLGSGEFQADIVNFSEAGMLCEFQTPVEFAAILQPADVRIEFPEPIGPCAINGIRARMLRIYVVSRRADQWPERLRCAWQFFNVPQSSFQQLRGVIECAVDEVEPAPQSTFERP
jgi:hypothetical protein